MTKLLIIILIQITFLNSLLAISRVQEVRQELEKANKNFYEQIEALSIEPDTILNVEQYDVVTEAIGETFAPYERLSKDLGSRRVIIKPRKQERLDHLLLNLVYYTNAGNLLMTILTQPGLASVLSEVSQKNLPFPKKFINRLIDRTNSQFRPERNQSEDDNSHQRFGTLYDSVNLWKQWRLQSIPKWLMNYINSAKNIMVHSRYLSTRHYDNQGIKQVFYGFKSALLYVTGVVALPKPYFMKTSEMVGIQRQLLPGDIATIRHLYKLTNIAFTGEWSHGLIYLGSWEDMRRYFSNDSATNNHFRKVCREKNLRCNSLLTYIEKALPKVADYYKSYTTFRGRELPRVVLESKGEGVIISNIFDGLMKDQLAVLRPRMSKKAKAQSIVKALEYVFLPYDYGFSLHSKKKLVCTEIIYNAYSPGVGEGIPDFDWITSNVLGQPINYATDLIKTFADNYGKGSQKLDFVLFRKADEGRGVTHSGTAEQLIQTVR
mgnify:CR=1 FL=1